MKKQNKIFRNVGGNQFRLLTESITDDKPQGSNLVRAGLKKVFASSGPEISYKRLTNVGLGYIKNVTDASKCALREAQELAPEFGYKDDEQNSRFVKSEDITHPLTTNYPSTNRTNTEENREVQIGKEILQILNDITVESLSELAARIKILAQELVKMHGGTSA